MGKKIEAAEVVDVQKRRAPSKHYVYVIELKWSDGSELTIYRRYSAFFDFHVALLDRFPKEAGESSEEDRIIPFLPGKKLFGRSHTYKVALSRVKLLDEYVKALVQLPSKVSECSDVVSFFEADKLDIKPPSAEEREKKPASLVSKLVSAVKEEKRDDKELNIGEVLILDQYRSVADYKKQNKGELSFKTGELFEVVEKNDNGWWFVSSEDEQQGWVPATFMEPVDDPNEEEHSEKVPVGDEKYITMQQYKAIREDEIGYDKGVVVKVLEKNLDGWWRVEYQGKVGWTPASYLEKLTVQSYEKSEAAEEVAGRKKNLFPLDTSPSSSKRSSPTPGSSSSGGPPMRPKKPDPRPPPMRRESISRPQSIHGAKGKFNFANVLAAGQAKQGNKPKTPGAGAKPKIEIMKKAEPPKKPEPPKSNGTVSLPKASNKPSVVGTGRAGSVSQKVSSLGAKLPASNGGSKPKMPAKGSKPSLSKGASAASLTGNEEEFKAVSGYTKEDDSGLTFPVGATLKLLEKSDTGWWYMEYKGDEGWAPSDFVEPIKRKPKKVEASKAKPSRPQLPSATAKPSRPEPVASAKPDRPRLPSSAEKPGLVGGSPPKGSVASLAAVLGGGGAIKPKPKPASQAAKPALKPTGGVGSSPGLGGVIASLNRRNTESSGVAAKPVVPKAAAKPVVPKAAAKPVVPKAAAKPSLPKAASKPALKPSAKPQPSGGNSNADEFLVTESYTKESDQEITVRKGEVVTVEEKDAGGWWFVANSKGESGWAPSDFLSPNTKKASPAKPAAADKPKPAVPVLPTKPSAAAKPKAVPKLPVKPTAAAKPSPAAKAASPSGGGVKALASVLAGGPGLPAGRKPALRPTAGAKPKPAVPVAAKKPGAKPRPAVGGKPKPPVAAAKPTAAPRNDNAYVAGSAYTAESAEEMSLKVGDCVTVEEKTEGGWWFAKNGSKEGWVPSDFLDPAGGSGPQVGVSCRGAFKGKVARRVCEQALKSQGRHREFIVRESETVPGDYSFTVKINSQIHHFKVVNKGDNFMVGDASFSPDLDEVTSYFFREPIYTQGGEKIKLGAPYTKPL